MLFQANDNIFSMTNVVSFIFQALQNIDSVHIFRFSAVERHLTAKRDPASMIQNGWRGTTAPVPNMSEVASDATKRMVRDDLSAFFGAFEV